MGTFNFFDTLANPERFMRYSGPILWGTGLAAAALLVGGSIWALFFTPPDYQMGESVRIMYVHVPAASMTMMAYAFMVVASIFGYVWRHQLADLAAREAAPMGLAFCILSLITGSIWGKITWGVWWDWDARMTSVLVLAFIYIGYMALWRAIENQAQAARSAALLCFVGAINLPIIKFSVEFWETLHQPATIITPEGPKMPPEMLLPLLTMMTGYAMLFGFFVTLRLRTILREKRQGSHAPSRPVSVAQPVTMTDDPAPRRPEPSSQPASEGSN
ncbi:MAG: heme ABC transporter permease [Aquisalinus sp.]|nr:heme ABC transporter permease [Aquisalinus sp.]